VRADAQARKLAQSSGVDIRYYNIITMRWMRLKPDVGHARAGEKRAGIGLGGDPPGVPHFQSRTVVGCYVLEGQIKRNAQVRVIRAGVVIHTGELDSLKRFKDDVKEVKSGSSAVYR